MSLNVVAFYLYRITGMILAIYLCTHLCFLTTVKTGDYSNLVKITERFLPLDLALFLAGIYNEINWIWLIIHEFGFLYNRRKVTLYLTFITALI